VLGCPCCVWNPSQAKDKVVASVEKAVKELKDDEKKNGELYVKAMKKALTKVRGIGGLPLGLLGGGRKNWQGGMKQHNTDW
jgi:hypothetical protein